MDGPFDRLFVCFPVAAIFLVWLCSLNPHFRRAWYSRDHYKWRFSNAEVRKRRGAPLLSQMYKITGLPQTAFQTITISLVQCNGFYQKFKSIFKHNIKIIIFQNNIHVSEVHCGSAVRFRQVLPGFLITAHHWYASLS